MPNLNFGQALRLTENNRIRSLFRLGKKLNAGFASVYFYPNQLSQARLCVSVAKKQVARAVNRNKMKRLVRESFRLQQHDLPPVDVVVVIYKSYQEFGTDQHRETLQQQWQRLAKQYNG